MGKYRKGLQALMKTMYTMLLQKINDFHTFLAYFPTTIDALRSIASGGTFLPLSTIAGARYKVSR